MELSEDDKNDRTFLSKLYEKRKVREQTKDAFFCFENSRYMIASDKETYVIVPQDMAVGHPLFMTGESDFGKFVTAISVIRQRRESSTVSVLWDIGANVGSICIPAVRRNYVEKAVAFEPEVELHKLLRANLILNEVDGRITTFRTALGKERSSKLLTMSDGNTGDYRIAGTSFENDAMGERSRRQQMIDVAPLDEFADLFEADKTLLWLDVQGYEGFVLAGAEKILDFAPPLVTEFWPYGMRRLDSLEVFQDVVCSGLYTEFVDLADPALEPRAPTKGEFARRYDAAGDDPNVSADLLFL
jgi:FkbM family methyltransferase